MKNLSILRDNYAVGIDLSSRPDCIKVIQITDNEFSRLNSGLSVFNIETEEIVDVIRNPDDVILLTLPEPEEPIEGDGGGV